MKYILMVLLGVVGPFCFGHSPKAKEAHIRIMKFLCDSGEKVSLCEPVQRLMEAQKQYDLALASEERKELSERLEESYDSEVDLYIKNLCLIPPAYMLTVCEVLSILNEAKEELHYRVNRRALGSEGNRIKMTLVQSQKREVREKRENYEVIREIAMEVVCDRKEGPKTFCDLLEELRTYEEENLYTAEAELKDARTALKSQTDVMCEIEKGKRHSCLHRVYLKALCGD